MWQIREKEKKMVITSTITNVKRKSRKYIHRDLYNSSRWIYVTLNGIHRNSGILHVDERFLKLNRIKAGPVLGRWKRSKANFEYGSTFEL